MAKSKILPDDTTVFATNDGINELSRVNVVNNTGVVSIGNGIELSSGSITWNSVLVGTGVYVYDPQDGTGKAHYVVSGSTYYKNGVVTGSIPYAVTTTGITSITGIMHSIEVYSSVKSAAWVLNDYEQKSRFW